MWMFDFRNRVGYAIRVTTSCLRLLLHIACGPQIHLAKSVENPTTYSACSYPFNILKPIHARPMFPHLLAIQLPRLSRSAFPTPSSSPLPHSLTLTLSFPPPPKLQVRVFPPPANSQPPQTTSPPSTTPKPPQHPPQPHHPLHPSNCPPPALPVLLPLTHHLLVPRPPPLHPLHALLPQPFPHRGRVRACVVCGGGGREREQGEETVVAAGGCGCGVAARWCWCVGV
jgi:hypothetical protein